MSIEDSVAMAAALGARITHDQTMLDNVATTLLASIEAFNPVSQDLDGLAELYAEAIGDYTKAGIAAKLSDDADEIQVKVEAAHNRVLDAINFIDVVMRELETLIEGIHSLDSGA